MEVLQYSSCGRFLVVDNSLIEIHALTSYHFAVIALEKSLWVSLVLPTHIVKNFCVSLILVLVLV